MILKTKIPFNKLLYNIVKSLDKHLSENNASVEFINYVATGIVIFILDGVFYQPENKDILCKVLIDLMENDIIETVDAVYTRCLKQYDSDIYDIVKKSKHLN